MKERKSSKTILRDFGVNSAIGYGVLTRMWSVFAGPVTLLLIVTRFSKVEQGYYYTFSSLLALQIFFELGLLTVMAQFAAHEFAFLSWGEKGIINGSENHRSRFIDLLSKGFKWYAVAAILLIIILIPAGLYFFSSSTSGFVGFTWRMPWAFAVIGVGCNLMLIPFYAVITGSGDVASINRREMMGGIVGSVIAWLVIAFCGGLYAIPAVTSGSIVIGIIYLFKIKPCLVKAVFKQAFYSEKSSYTISWWSEVWPMQWKIALSWVSGYFIFQLFTPVLFKYYGPIRAGQMGITLTTVNSILGIAIMWLNTKNPEFGKLIALKKWIALDVLFNRVLNQILIVFSLLSVVLIIILTILQLFSIIPNRFLPISEIIVFLVATAGTLVVSCWATYMRAHKIESMMPLSLISAILMTISTLYFGIKFSSIGMVVGYFLITFLWGIPSTYLCLIKFKKKYQV